ASFCRELADVSLGLVTASSLEPFELRLPLQDELVDLVENPLQPSLRDDRSQLLLDRCRLGFSHGLPMLNRVEVFNLTARDSRAWQAWAKGSDAIPKADVRSVTPRRP